MARILTSSTARVIALLVVGIFLSSCYGEGGDQLSGMYDLSFSSTAVCNSQVQYIPFRNVSGQEIVIKGVAISGGTDPLGNFRLSSVIVGAEEITSINGVLNEVIVPAGANYKFTILYVPRTENESHSAILDIAFASPKEGVIQVQLTGSSAGRTDSCPTQVIGGPVVFDGELTISIDRLVLINGAASGLPIRSDQSVPSRPYIPAQLSVIFSKDLGDITLPQIGEEDSFILPPPDPLKVPQLASLIKNDTQITSYQDASGDYDAATGKITIKALAVHLNNALDDFSADLTIDITTDLADFTSTGIAQSDILNGGFLVVGQSVAGSPINAETGKVTLVGISTFTNGTGDLGDIINDRPAILRIEATIIKPLTQSSP